MPRLTVLTAPTPEPFEETVAAYLRHIRAERRSAQTERVYRWALKKLHDYLRDNDLPQTAGEITRRHIDAFRASLTEAGASPGTAATIHRSLRAFWTWAADAGETVLSPMAGTRSPKPPLPHVHTLTEREIADLIKACAGNGFEDRRAKAILALFLGSGVRLGELAGLRMQDLDLEHCLISVTGKGNKPRRPAYLEEAGEALDAYLALRRRHAHRTSEYVWLGEQGPLGASRIRAIVQQRGRGSGLESLHPHQLRHTFVARWLRAGLPQATLIQQMGWSDKTAVEMIARYGRDARAATAVEHVAALGDYLRQQNRR